jgi:5-bromo-4-chloroindolyl phosphate hydrolysis protein
MSMQEPESQGMRFDLTINLGHIIILGTLFTSIVSTWVTYKVSITNNELRLARLEEFVKAQGASNQEIATDISSIKQDIAIIRYRVDRVDRPK